MLAWHGILPEIFGWQWGDDTRRAHKFKCLSVNIMPVSLSINNLAIYFSVADT